MNYLRRDSTLSAIDKHLPSLDVQGRESVMAWLGGSARLYTYNVQCYSMGWIALVYLAATEVELYIEPKRAEQGMQQRLRVVMMRFGGGEGMW